MSPTATLPLFVPTLISKMNLPPMEFVYPFIGLVTAYHLVAPYYSTTKKRAWLLTACASGVMTGASLPFLVDFVRSKGELGVIRAAPSWAVLANRFFQAYLASDLLMGSIYYRKYVTWTMGWGHHAAYICIVELCIRRGWSNIFCLSAFMELPTFLLAIASLHPILRNNTLFTVTFFSTRILLHLTLIALFVLPSGRAVVDGAWAPSVLLSLAFPMHCVWFSGSVKGFIKRANERKAVKIAMAVDPAKVPSSEPEMVTVSNDARVDIGEIPGDVQISMNDVPRLASNSEAQSPRSISKDFPSLLTEDDFIPPRSRTEPPSPSSPTRILAPIVTISSSSSSSETERCEGSTLGSGSERFITLRSRRPLPLRVQQLLPSRFRPHPSSSPLHIHEAFNSDTLSSEYLIDHTERERKRFRTMPGPGMVRRKSWKMIYDRLPSMPVAINIPRPAVPVPSMPSLEARERLYRYVGLGRDVVDETNGGVMPGGLGVERSESVMGVGRSVHAY